MVDIGPATLCDMRIQLHPPPPKAIAPNLRPMYVVAKRSQMSDTAEHWYKRSPKDGSPWPYAIGLSVLSVCL